MSGPVRVTILAISCITTLVGVLEMAQGWQEIHAQQPIYADSTLCLTRSARDSGIVRKDTMCVLPSKPKPESLTFASPETTRYWQQAPWHPEPMSLIFSQNGKTVLKITPDGKFVLGPGATADSAARAIVALAEQYVKWKTQCDSTRRKP